jgi:RNA polymerase subunit RPABC4/transcription elongation factor Spt4
MKISATPLYCAKCRALRPRGLDSCPVCHNELVTSRWGEYPLASNSEVRYVECTSCHKTVNRRAGKCPFCQTALPPT